MTNTNMEQQQSSYKEKERIDLREPRRFKVTIFNDDFTTMEFVVNKFNLSKIVYIMI